MTDAQIRTLMEGLFGVTISADGAPLPMADEPGGMIASGVTEGVPWAVCRAPIWGAANGYVYVGPEHPILNGESPGDGYLDVPGGWTYAHVDGWAGFDTCHSGDIWPGMPDSLIRLNEGLPWGRHWDDAKMEEVTRRLAGQIATCNRLGLWEDTE